MKRMAFGLLAAALAAAPLAAQTNTGSQSNGPLGQHVLTAPDGVGGVIDVLYAPSEDDDATFRAAVAAITGGVADYYDARVGTPDATLLGQYDCVMTWANYAFFDENLMGDRLADFVDAGGRVVLGSFSTYVNGNNLGGRIMTSGYSPVYSPTSGNHFTLSDYSGDGVSSIYAGVSAFAATYRDVLALQGGGVQDGTYDDGEIAVAFRPDYGVVYTNGTGTNPPGGNSGDWPLLTANACGALPYAAPLIQEIPTLSGVGFAALMLALAGAAIVMVRRRAARA